MDRERIRHLVELLKSSGVAELTLRDGEQVVRVRRANGLSAQAPPVVEEIQLGAPGTSESAGQPTARVEGEYEEVRTRLVGFFHHAKEAGGEPLVTVGQKVKQGQVVGMIEALQTLTEVVSPVEGEVVAVDVEDGDAVQYGDVLLRIRPAQPGNGGGY